MSVSRMRRTGRPGRDECLSMDHKRTRRAGARTPAIVASRVVVRLGVRLPVKAQYQVCLGDHPGEFLLRVEHRNMVVAISGEDWHELRN